MISNNGSSIIVKFVKFVNLHSELEIIQIIQIIQSATFLSTFHHYAKLIIQFIIMQNAINILSLIWLGCLQVCLVGSSSQQNHYVELIIHDSAPSDGRPVVIEFLIDGKNTHTKRICSEGIFYLRLPCLNVIRTDRLAIGPPLSYVLQEIKLQKYFSFFRSL